MNVFCRVECVLPRRRWTVLVFIGQRLPALLEFFEAHVLVVVVGHVGDVAQRG